jgi:hypothetical protein
MRTTLLVIVTILGLSSNAFAETFMCQGTGRFSEVGNQTVNLEWKKNYQKVLLENDQIKVQVNIDKANSDGTHYLAIDVLDLNKTGVTSIRGAKGSLKDMVQYIDSTSSIVQCLPIEE